MNDRLLTLAVHAFAGCLLFLSLARSVTADPPLPAGHPRLQITTDQPSPVIVHLGAVDHNILALEIEAQRTERSAVEPYKPLPGDETKVNEQHGVVKSVDLIRDGQRVGYLVGKHRKHVWFFEELIGDALDQRRPTTRRRTRYRWPAGRETHTPTTVCRKSKPIDIANPATSSRHGTIFTFNSLCVWSQGKPTRCRCPIFA